MNAPTTPFLGARNQGCPATAVRIYGLLLRAYPPAFRAEYGPEMTQLFRDQCRIGDAGSISFWTHLLLDVAQSAPALRVDAWRARGHESTRTLGVIMKLVAALTVLLGVFEALSAMAEGVLGMQQGFGGSYLVAVILCVLAGALLLVAGVAALRGAEAGRRTASRAAIASLVAFVLARLVFGWMSIFAQLVGVVLPLVVLATLHWPRRRPGTA